MKVIPRNRRILVEPYKITADVERRIQIPDGISKFKLDKEPYKAGKILAVAEDCSDSFKSNYQNEVIVYEGHLAEEVEIMGVKHILVPENYVLCSFYYEVK